MLENYQNKYYAQLLDKLILNKEQKDMESFITNIFNFYNYIYINNPHLQKQFIDNLIKYDLYNELNESNLLPKFYDIKMIKDLIDKLSIDDDVKIKLFLKGGSIKDIIEQKELLYVKQLFRRISDTSIKIRQFLETLYDLKRGNNKYNDTAKKHDYKYMDGITFIYNAKNFYDNQNFLDFIKQYGNIQVPDKSKLQQIDRLLDIKKIMKQLIIKDDDGDENGGDDDSDDTRRWTQIFYYIKNNEFEVSIEFLPSYLKDLDEKCCCNDSQYFDNLSNMSALDIAKKIYKNETAFLKKFIYETQEETFMTIFDSKRRKRCKQCNCCKKRNHRIKISQLYNLVKGCIIYQKKLVKHEINNLDIFQEKNSLTCNCCDFKTIYECIIEDLFFDKTKTIERTEKESISDKEYYHYKYIGNLRDHILNNFQTNLFPIFDRQLWPDFANTNFNPDLYFFDFEITIIIDNINQEHYDTNKKTINTLLNQSYFNKYSDIRSEISHDDLKCIILSYRDLLIDWYDIINKTKQLSDNMFYDKIYNHLYKIAGIFLLIFVVIMKYFSADKDNIEIIKTIGDIILLIIVYFQSFVKSDEPNQKKKLIDELKTIMRQKNFIYKDVTWDDKTGLNHRVKYEQQFPELANSKLYIKNEIPKYESEKTNYDLNNICRYANYLSNKLNILNRTIHTSIEIKRKKRVSPILKKKKYSDRLKKLDSRTEVSLRNTFKKREVSLRNTFKKRIRRICKSKKLHRKNN
jgi:hypothetical protein